MQPQTLCYTQKLTSSTVRPKSSLLAGSQYLASHTPQYDAWRLSFPPISIRGGLLQSLLSTSSSLPQEQRLHYVLSLTDGPHGPWVLVARPCKRFQVLLLQTARSQSFEDVDRRGSVASPVDSSKRTCDCSRCGAHPEVDIIQTRRKRRSNC
jgi:hypothetical protein